MSPAPTARVRRSPICARSWKPQACASTSITSPYLVRINECFRLGRPGGGVLVGDDELRAALEHCERANAGEPITIFEIETAAAFCLFAQHPADVVLLEVGLGGRLDATNVIDAPLATVIAPVSMDHTEFLGDTLTAIAGEKAAHHQARRAGDLRRAVGRGDGRDRAAGEAHARAAACGRRSNGMSVSSAGGWSIRTIAA